MMQVNRTQFGSWVRFEDAGRRRKHVPESCWPGVWAQRRAAAAIGAAPYALEWPGSDRLLAVCRGAERASAPTPIAGGVDARIGVPVDRWAVGQVVLHDRYRERDDLLDWEGRERLDLKDIAGVGEAQ